MFQKIKPRYKTLTFMFIENILDESYSFVERYNKVKLKKEAKKKFDELHEYIYKLYSILGQEKDCTCDLVHKVIKNIKKENYNEVDRIKDFTETMMNYNTANYFEYINKAVSLVEKGMRDIIKLTGGKYENRND